jgi:hypothetical protein
MPGARGSAHGVLRFSGERGKQCACGALPFSMRAFGAGGAEKRAERAPSPSDGPSSIP